jgi:hypothetical protein
MGARNHHLCGHWRDELRRLEFSVQDLEAQCCPPDPATLREPVWQPATEGDREPPRVEHDRLRSARPGEALRLTARVTDPAGVQSVRLRYRLVRQFDDYATLEMKPDATGAYTATVPAGFTNTTWDFMYFIETIDTRGNGRNWPDLAVETPYVIVPIAR